MIKNSWERKCMDDINIRFIKYMIQQNPGIISDIENIYDTKALVSSRFYMLICMTFISASNLGIRTGYPRLDKYIIENRNVIVHQEGSINSSIRYIVSKFLKLIDKIDLNTDIKILDYNNIWGNVI